MKKIFILIIGLSTMQLKAEMIDSGYVVPKFDPSQANIPCNSLCKNWNGRYVIDPEKSNHLICNCGGIWLDSNYIAPPSPNEVTINSFSPQFASDPVVAQQCTTICKNQKPAKTWNKIYQADQNYHLLCNCIDGN